MDEEMINQIEDNVEDLPQEAKDFIFGDDFETVSQELSLLLTNENEKKDLPNEIMLFLFGTRTIEELVSYIGSLTTTDENKQKIKEVIDEKIINELSLLIEVNKEIDDEAGEGITNPENKKNSIPLTSLADRLKQASIAAPAKRDYSLNQKPGGVSGTETPGHTIDPYHESIDNE